MPGKHNKKDLFIDFRHRDFSHGCDGEWMNRSQRGTLTEGVNIVAFFLQGWSGCMFLAPGWHAAVDLWSGYAYCAHRNDLQEISCKALP
jgi:hypothetical protein